MPPHLILNTRPEPQASRFTAELRAMFGQRLEVITSPLMRAEYLPLTLPTREFAGLVLTSETGALAASRLMATGQHLPKLAFCVGDRTAEVAFSAGLEPVSAAGDAGDLLRLIAARAEDPLLYLHGEDRAADLAAALTPAGRKVVSLVAYRQQPQAMSDGAVSLLAANRPVILPFFSPRSVRLFLAAAGDLPLATVQPVVISENARTLLPDLLAARARVAARPDGRSMLTAIADCILPPSA